MLHMDVQPPSVARSKPLKYKKIRASLPVFQGRQVNIAGAATGRDRATYDRASIAIGGRSCGIYKPESSTLQKRPAQDTLLHGDPEHNQNQANNGCHLDRFAHQ